ncbi:hypothetical protein [Psychromonas sp. KJ10-2]|uniref:hypothetical protein n=1 Tax=Psychromonas sp. KJ10-2 TaxID=3391822 RepID=UPI0039B5A988
MTSIASWFHNEGHDSIWVVGDSKITNTSSMLIDIGAKIFSIPLICKGVGKSGFLDSTFLETKIGLAYAGSSLVGLNVQAALTTVFANLGGTGIAPSMDSIVEFSKNIIKSYISTLAVSADRGALCEFSMFGYCHVDNELKMYHLKPDLSSGMFDIEIITYLESEVDNNFVLLLGDKRYEINEEINNKRTSYSSDHILWQRAPQTVLKEIVQTDKYETVGGHIQMGICDPSGFHPYSTLNYVKGEEPKAYLSYLGFHTSGYSGQVGNCFVNINGMP